MFELYFRQNASRFLQDSPSHGRISFLRNQFRWIVRRQRLLKKEIRERIKLLRDVLTAADFFFEEALAPYDPAELVPQKGDAAMARRVLEKARSVLSEIEFKHDPLDHALRAASQELGIKAGQMFQP